MTKDLGTFRTRTLVGDGIVVDTDQGPIEFTIAKISNREAELCVRAPRELKITLVHMNPDRKPQKRSGNV